jgi:hypothetical protein
MANDFFKILSYVTFEKKPWDKLTDSEKGSVNPYMLHRYVSLYEPYIEIANLCQRIPQDEKKLIYITYSNLLPKKKIWNKYLKSEKNSINKDLLICLSKYFECSCKEAEEYIDFLNKEEIENILSKLGLDDKEIKKLMK